MKTMYMKMILVAAAVTLALLAIPGDSSAQGRGGKGKAKSNAKQAQVEFGPVTGNVAHGRELFYSYSCYGCHGYNGETGARDLVGTKTPNLANEESFVAFLRLRADVAPLLPSTRMPNYPKNSLSDTDAKDIYAYIRSFRLDAPDVKDVPTLEKILESAKEPYTGQ